MKKQDYKKINDIKLLEEKREELKSEIINLEHKYKLIKNNDNYSYIEGVKILNKIDKIYDEYYLLIERIESIKFSNKISDLKSNIKNFKICMLVKLNKVIEDELSKEKELIKKLDD